MTYKLNVWNKPNSEEVRIYIEGTNRRGIYLTKRPDGTAGWSSKSNETPPKYRSGNHYGKIRKDGKAVHEVCDEFGIVIHETSFAEALSIANAPQITTC